MKKESSVIKMTKVKQREKYQIKDIKEETVIGSKKAKKILKRELLNFMKYKDEFKKRGMDHPKGLTLYGPPGVGKTSLVRWVISRLFEKGELPENIGYIEVNGHELAAGGVGSINKKVHKFFERLRTDMKTLGFELMIIVIDEIDATIPKRTTGSVLTKERTSSVLKELEGFQKHKECLYIIGTTNRPYDIDSAARKGRIGKMHFIDVPRCRERQQLIDYYIMSRDIEFEKTHGKRLSSRRLAKMTRNYTGDDFKAIGGDLLNVYLEGDKKPLSILKIFQIFVDHGPDKKFFPQLLNVRRYATSQLSRSSRTRRKINREMKTFVDTELESAAIASAEQDMEAERTGKVFRTRGE